MKKNTSAQNTSHLIGNYTQQQRSNMKQSVAVIIGVWITKFIGHLLEKRKTSWIVKCGFGIEILDTKYLGIYWKCC